MGPWRSTTEELVPAGACVEMIRTGNVSTSVWLPCGKSNCERQSGSEPAEQRNGEMHWKQTVLVPPAGSTCGSGGSNVDHKRKPRALWNEALLKTTASHEGCRPQGTRVCRGNTQNLSGGVRRTRLPCPSSLGAAVEVPPKGLLIYLFISTQVAQEIKSELWIFP